MLRCFGCSYHFPGTRQQFAVAVKFADAPALVAEQVHVVLLPDALSEVSFMLVESLSQLPPLRT